MLAFLAGPLAHEDALAALGAVPKGPARLHGQSLVAGGPAGLPLWSADGETDGILAEADRDALHALGASLKARLTPVRLADRTRANALIGPSGNGPAWDAEGWAKTHSAGFAAAIPLLISEGASAAGRLPMILSQADARLRAGQSGKGEFADGRHRSDVVLAEHAAAYRGFFGADVLHLEVPRFSGGAPLELRREVFRGTDATLVLPYDPVRDEVLLVEQFRAGAYLRGDAWPWTLEPVAGLVDAGETPEHTAIRETLEEAGVRLERVIQVAAGYPSPGITSEFYHLFIGLADLSSTGGGGLDHEGEDIRVHVLPFDRFNAYLESPQASVLPLLTLGLYLRAARPALRQGG